MTVLLDETFATGIPSGFATSLGGGVAATYNSGAQAADLVAGSGSLYAEWRIDAVSAQASMSVEIDAEVTAFTTIPRLGVAFNASSGLTPFGMFELPYGGNYYFGDLLGTYQLNNFSTLGAAVGSAGFRESRYTYRFETYLATAGRRIAAYINDRLIWASTVGAAPTVLAGVYMFNHTARLHSIKITDSPVDLEATGFFTRIGSGRSLSLPRRFLDLPQWPGGKAQVVSRGRSISRRPAYYPGFYGQSTGQEGFIEGTTNVLSGGVNLPYPARVGLFLNETGQLVDSVAVSIGGNYRFDNLRRDFRYMVVAQDRNSGYRAVVADNIQPDPYP